MSSRPLGICGLLHGLDFTHTKDGPSRPHDQKNALCTGLDKPYTYAIATHSCDYSSHETKEPLDFALRAAETVTGLIIAALIRHIGMKGMEVKSIKAFDRVVNRETIKECEKSASLWTSFF